MKAIVQSYIIPHDPAWDVYSDAYNGDITITRQSRTGEDKWGISIHGMHDRLHRKAIAWRDANPTAPFFLPGDNLVSAPPDRAIYDMLDAPAQPSERADAWKRAHQFTLDEALYVVGATP